MKKYLPFLELRSLVKSIVSYSLVKDENGILLRDRFLQKLVTVLFCEMVLNDKEIENLFIVNDEGETELNVELAIEEYDKIVAENGVEALNVPYEVYELVEDEIVDRLEAHNSIPAVFARALAVAVKKIPSEADMTSLFAQVPDLLKMISNIGSKRKKKSE